VQLAEHRKPAWASIPTRLFRLLVVLLPGLGLLLFAKHLFVAARTRQSSTKDGAGSVRRVMVVAGREATYAGPGAKAHHRVAGAEAGRNPKWLVGPSALAIQCGMQMSSI
jgi:hypothetical protein